MKLIKLLIASILFILTISFTDVVIANATILATPDASAWHNAGFTTLDVKTGGGIDAAKGLLNKLFTLAKVIIESIAVIFGVIIGARMITSDNDSEGAKKQWGTFYYLLIGIFILNIPSFLTAFDPSNVFGVDGLARVKASCAGLPSLDLVFFDAWRIECFMLSQIIVPFENFAGILAVFFIIFAGVKLALNFGDEETIKAQKTTIKAAIFGLIIVALARSIQYAVFNTNANVATSAIASLISLFVSILGPIAVFVLVIAGIYLIFAGTDEAKYTKAISIMKGVVIALVLVFTSFILMNEFMPKVAKVNLGTVNTSTIITK